MIRVKRVFDHPEPEDGYRLYVNRTWPKEIKRNALDGWMRKVAPSDLLSHWFSDDPSKWNEFVRLYTEELKNKMSALDKLEVLEMEQKTITLLHSSRSNEYNSAVVLKEVMEHLDEFREMVRREELKKLGIASDVERISKEMEDYGGFEGDRMDSGDEK
ncbi:MAG: DUF488 domain-containing protein [Methermicoccaceae archaeon]